REYHSRMRKEQSHDGFAAPARPEVRVMTRQTAVLRAGTLFRRAGGEWPDDSHSHAKPTGARILFLQMKSLAINSLLRWRREASPLIEMLTGSPVSSNMGREG